MQSLQPTEPAEKEELENLFLQLNASSIYNCL